MSYLFAGAFITSIFGTACPEETTADAGIGVDVDPPISTPRWAFEPWISKDISNDADTREFVAGFQERDIPVGAVVIDSPWETNYNTFVPNPDRYPSFDQLVADLHADDIRIVLWVTQMVNESSIDFEPGGDTYPGESPNFREGARAGFFVNDAETYLWWKGYGAAVDFFNPDAVEWWHAQQDPLLEVGIDGWKLDFGEQYISTTPIVTADGEKSRQEYSEAYYRDYWRHGIERRGPEFVTMVRAYDESYGFAPRFYARKEHAPVVWMGDQFHSWAGLVDGLDHVFRSANAGYQMLGTDIGGYLMNDGLEELELDPELFMRWTAVSSLLPFFQLHGQANLAPWTMPSRTNEVVESYRHWAWLHHELVPFFHSLVAYAYDGGPNVVAPVGDEQGWADDWRFIVGDTFLVAPILDETGIRDVKLPGGTDYYDWFHPELGKLPGGQTLVAYDTETSVRIPVFVKAGSVIPMRVERGFTGVAGSFAADDDVVLVFPGGNDRFARLDEDGALTILTLNEVSVGSATELTVAITRAPRPVLVKVHKGGLAVGAVHVDGEAVDAVDSESALTGDTYGFYDEGDGPFVWVRVRANSRREARVSLSP